jgi:hypothetical protein
MAVGTAGGDDHGVGDRGFAGKVDFNRVLGFHVLETGSDDRPKILILRSPRSGGRGKRRKIRFTQRQWVQFQTLFQQRDRAPPFLR